MNKRNHSLFILMGGIGFVLLLSGCPKKVDTAKSSATQGEAAAPEAVSPAPAPKMEEMPVVREAEVPMAEGGLADAYFDYDRYTIRDDARATLESSARWLNANPKARVKIEGHCDERGTNEYNLALGERRAQAVKRFLSSVGVESSRLSTISYGEEKPVCTEPTEGCFEKNRRVHFTIQ